MPEYGWMKVRMNGCMGGLAMLLEAPRGDLKYCQRLVQIL